MKIIICYLIIVYLICVTSCGEVSHNSPSQNVENSKLIKIGMTKNDVIRIMGLPDERNYIKLDQDSTFFYRPPFGASSGINIFFGQGDTITRIIHFE